jgi:ATP-binding cassette subfamily F protein 3
VEEALEQFEGTILAVSHDRYFINRIAQRILYFEGKELKELIGNYDSYLEARARQNEEKERVQKTVGWGGAAYKQQKEEAARVRKLMTQIAKVEQEIEELDALARDIENRLCHPENAQDFELMMKLSGELEEVKAKSLGAMELWEKLNEEI